MSDTNLKPKAYGHLSAGSIDTNASGIAESTISMALSRFPEPPSSIPSTPLRSEFGGTPSPSRTTFLIPPLPNSPLRLTTQGADRLSTSSLHTASRDRSFKTTSTAFCAQNAKDSTPGPSQLPLAYDSDGASSIDVDATEDRLLSTSFITSLLRENKAQRRLTHATTSDAMSGISEMTYPPLLDQLNTADTLYACHSSGRPFDYSMPPQVYNSSNRISGISGESETLHSNQGHTPMIRTTNMSSISRSVHAQTTTWRNVSDPNQCSSNLLTESPQSTDKPLHRRLSTTYETGDDMSDGCKAFISSYTSATGAQGTLLRGEPTDFHIKDTVTDPTSSSLLSRISLRRAFVWKKVKPLPPVPKFPQIPLTTEYAHRKYEDSASLPELVSRAGSPRDLLEKGQNSHHSMASHDVLFEPPPVPCSVHEAERAKSKIAPMAVASPLLRPHTIPSPSKHQPSTKISVPRNKKRIYCLIFCVSIVALAAVGAGVGVSVASRKKYHLPACAGAFTGVACNLGNYFLSLSIILIKLINILDATCVCTTSAGCNGLAKAIVDLLPMVNQNFVTNISLTSAYNSLWIMQGNSATTNCVSQALLIDIGNGNDQQLYPNRTQWAQTALLWNAIQTQDINAAGQLQQFVQHIPWTSLGTTDGPLSTASSEPKFSTTIAGFTFNFASQMVTEPSASFVTLGQPTNAQISRVSSQGQTTLNRMYAFAQGMFFSQQP